MLVVLPEILQALVWRGMIACMTNAEQSQWRPRDTLANRFRLLRAELGVSQREFGELCGIPSSQVQTIEDGRSPRGLDVKVKKIALACGVDRDWLMWGGELADPSKPGPESPLSGLNRRPLAYLVRKRPALTLIAPSASACAAAA